MFITKIFNELKQANIVSSGEDFSIRFLRRSPKYYSAIKAQGRDVKIELLVELKTNLLNTRKNLEQCADLNLLATRYKKWRDIEGLVGNEIKLRTNI